MEHDHDVLVQLVETVVHEALELTADEAVPFKGEEPSRCPYLASFLMAHWDMREMSFRRCQKTSVSKSLDVEGVRSSRISS